MMSVEGVVLGIPHVLNHQMCLYYHQTPPLLLPCLSRQPKAKDEQCQVVTATMTVSDQIVTADSDKTVTVDTSKEHPTLV